MKSKIEKRWFKKGQEVGKKIAEEHEDEFKYAIDNSPEKYKNLLKEFLVLYKEGDYWDDVLSYDLRKDVGNNINYEPSTSELIDEMEELEGHFDSGFYTGVVQHLQSKNLI